MHPTSTGNLIAIDVDALITPHMTDALAALGSATSLLSGMGRYHLGWVDREFAAIPFDRVDRGKRIRPLLTMLCCAAAGGDPASAAPLAAAIELLHNFTLIHDDIQDHSPTRRHRPTVWALWGNAQAINAGDAMFAAAHLALYRLRDLGVDPRLVLDLAEAFDRMTIDIVAGQVADLSFETRSDVAPDEYLRMIAGKTSAIVRFAAWAGSLLGGADTDTAERFGEFGYALGMGFQIQDDLLGVWGTSAQTGKAEADDIRRKKQSLPILLLRAAADDSAAAEIDRIYARPEIDKAGVASVLGLLDRFNIRSEVELHVRGYHDQAEVALTIASNRENPARRALSGLIDALSSRSA